MKIKYYIGIIFFLGVIIVSCNDDQCNLDTDPLMKTEILVKDTVLTSIKYLDSLSIYSPEWTDSIHYSEEDASFLYFMLSPESDTTEIIFTSKQADNNDTIIFYYQREFVLLTPECGFVINYKIDTFINTWNYIDSLELVDEDKDISTDKDGYIQIYF